MVLNQEPLYCMPYGYRSLFFVYNTLAHQSLTPGSTGDKKELSYSSMTKTAEKRHFQMLKRIMSCLKRTFLSFRHFPPPFHNCLKSIREPCFQQWTRPGVGEVQVCINGVQRCIKHMPLQSIVSKTFSRLKGRGGSMAL